jgi:cupin 2 domain-containing protein
VLAGNIFLGIPVQLPSELLEVLWQTPGLRLERIVSRGHTTPDGQLYDQATDEWVLMLTGSARLRIEGQGELHELRPGDYLLLPAYCKHRVEWTDPRQDSIWLALHVSPAGDPEPRDLTPPATPPP